MKKKLTDIIIDELDYIVNNNMLEEFITIYNEYDIPIDNLNNYLIDAAYDGSNELAFFLIDKTNAQVNHEDNMPLIHAANRNNIVILKKLLKHKDVNPTAKKGMALYVAIKSENDEIIETLWTIESLKKVFSKARPDLYEKLRIKFLEKNIKGF